MFRTAALPDASVLGRIDAPATATVTLADPSLPTTAAPLTLAETLGEAPATLAARSSLVSTGRQAGLVPGLEPGLAGAAAGEGGEADSAGPAPAVAGLVDVEEIGIDGAEGGEASEFDVTGFEATDFEATGVAGIAGVRAIDDDRPCFRVATFGLAQRFHRLLEIICRHARHNAYRFEICDDGDPGNYDIALVDVTTHDGADIARSLRLVAGSQPVIGVGRRLHHARGSDDVQLRNFSLDVLTVLNHTADGLLRRRRLRLRPVASSQVRSRNGVAGPLRSPGEARWTGRAGAADRSADRSAGRSAAHSAGRSTEGAPAKVSDDEGLADEASRDGQEQGQAQPETARRHRPPRVLIVDSSPSIRSQVSVAIRRIGADAEEASSLEAARDVLARRRYELVITELDLVDGDGFEVVRLLRQLGSRRRPPVVVLSERDGWIDQARAALAGCSGFLAKPVSYAILHATVRRTLARRQHSARDSGYVATASLGVGPLAPRNGWMARWTTHGGSGTMLPPASAGPVRRSEKRA